jgi:large subunit ribosomal protein L3
VPVTVLQTGPCQVVQRKTAEKEGYEAVQLGFDEQKAQRLSRPLQGHFKKAEAAPRRVLCEFLVDGDSEAKVGDEFTAAAFEGTGYVDVSGVTKGRGYQGVVRRHGMAGQPASHGSKSTRRSGSIGQCEFPARVFKGKRMPGQHGNVKRTVQNLQVVAIRPEDSVILVKGAVPGPTGGIVLVQKALKKKGSTPS